jgi:hypothetical protein
MTGGKHKVAALEMLGRLFKPAPAVPMTRSEFHKVLIPLEVMMDG